MALPRCPLNQSGAHDFICPGNHAIGKKAVSIFQLHTIDRALRTELVLSQPHVKKVSKIHLYWGCLAAGTKVTMLDGSQKNLCAK